MQNSPPLLIIPNGLFRRRLLVRLRPRVTPDILFACMTYTYPPPPPPMYTHYATTTATSYSSSSSLKTYAAPITPPSSSQMTVDRLPQEKVSLPSFGRSFPPAEYEIPTPPPEPASPVAEAGVFTSKDESSLDWLGSGTSAVAEKTCEMICYLWFAPPSSPSSSTAAKSSLQLSPSPALTSFLSHVLQTTQLSQSVIVLSLHYIYRLKCLNPRIEVRPGSEFRVSLVGLVLANKYLDDNTYTNRTWAEVSGVSLDEINKMEREFLKGLDWDLSLGSSSPNSSSDSPSERSARWHSWLRMLKGLVYAKERDLGRLHPTHSPRKRRPVTSSKRRPVSSYAAIPRARSISPPPFRFSYTLPVPNGTAMRGVQSTNTSPSKISMKRPAEFDEPPSKRRPVSMISYTVIPPQEYDYSPIERQLNSMSLSSNSPLPSPVPVSRTTSLGEMLRPEESRRLVQRAAVPPEKLYFWSASAGTDDERRPVQAQQQVQPPPAIPKAKLKYSAPPVHQHQHQHHQAAPILAIPQPWRGSGGSVSAHPSPLHHPIPQRPQEWDRRLPPLQTLDFNLGIGLYQPQPQSTTYVSPLVHALRPIQTQRW